MGMLSQVVTNKNVNKMQTDYEKQANDFLKKTNSEINISFLKNDYHFNDDKEKRDIYSITIKRGSRIFNFNFGNSIANSGFYAQQGVKKTKIDREFLGWSDAKIWYKYYKFNLMPKVGKDKIIRPTEPTNYDVLACLTKYDPYTFDDFCECYGYDNDSIKAKEVYNAVVDEYKNVCMIWNEDEINELSEIS